MISKKLDTALDEVDQLLKSNKNSHIYFLVLLSMPA